MLFGSIRRLNRPIGWMLKDTPHERFGIFYTSTWGDHSRSMAERPSIVEMDRQLRDARTNPLTHWEWLAQLPAQATQQVVKHYVRAWHRYFSGVRAHLGSRNAHSTCQSMFHKPHGSVSSA